MPIRIPNEPIEAPQTATLVVLLGASGFPKLASAAPHPARAASAQALTAYFLAADGFGLLPANLLSLFDAPDAPEEQSRQIASFLHRRLHESETQGHTIRNLIICYIGHGAYTVEPRPTYYLAVRATAGGREQTTGYRAAALAQTLAPFAQTRRLFLVVDASYSAGMSAHLSGLNESALLLAAAGAEQTVSTPPGATFTMFTGALLSVLQEGSEEEKYRKEHFSFSEVRALMRHKLEQQYGAAAAQPQLRARRKNSEILAAPVFPNPGWRPPPAPADPAGHFSSFFDTLFGGQTPSSSGPRNWLPPRVFQWDESGQQDEEDEKGAPDQTEAGSLARAVAALTDAFSRDELIRTLHLRMNVVLEKVVADKAYTEQVYELVSWAQRQGRLDELLTCAHTENPKHPLLKSAYEALVAPQADQQPGGTPPAQVQSAGGQPAGAQPASSAGPAAWAESGAAGDHQVFLAYVREDAGHMRTLRALLDAAGVRVWVDEEDLKPGTPIWEEAIQHAIRGAQCMVVILSPGACKSKWVRREIIEADRCDVRIFPVLAHGEPKDAVPLALVDVQYVEARRDFPLAVREQLLPAVRRHLGLAGAAPAIWLPPPNSPAETILRRLVGASDRHVLLGSYTYSYELGQVETDYAWPIAAPESSGYLGEWAVGLPVKNGLVDHDMRKPAALEVVLFDKGDGRTTMTTTRMLLSLYAHDHLYEQFVHPKSALLPRVAAPGVQFQLDGVALQLDVRVRDVSFTFEGYYQNITLDVQVWRND